MRRMSTRGTGSRRASRRRPSHHAESAASPPGVPAIESVKPAQLDDGAVDVGRAGSSAPPTQAAHAWRGTKQAPGRPHIISSSTSRAHCAIGLNRLRASQLARRNTRGNARAVSGDGRACEQSHAHRRWLPRRSRVGGGVLSEVDLDKFSGAHPGMRPARRPSAEQARPETTSTVR